MRYIQKINGTVVEYLGPNMGNTYYLDNGWLQYSGVLPLSRLDVIDNTIVELPEPDPINKYQDWYTNNPDLIPRVREYASALSSLNLPFTAKTDEIATTINALPIEDSMKLGKILQIQTAFNNIVLNLEYLDVQKPQFTAWSEMPLMIENLPQE